MAPLFPGARGITLQTEQQIARIRVIKFRGAEEQLERVYVYKPEHQGRGKGRETKQPAPGRKREGGPPDFAIRNRDDGDNANNECNGNAVCPLCRGASF